MKKVLILGGTKFFGKRLVETLIDKGIEVTVATRGLTSDPFGSSVRRVLLNRQDPGSVENALRKGEWDIVYDQTCYSSKEAAEAYKVLRGRIKRFVFTSTMAVYPFGERRAERDYDPFTDTFNLTKDRQAYKGIEGYREAKRHAEAFLVQQTDVPVAAVRFPIVIGPDDYTNRLRFYVDHVMSRTVIGIPNPVARLSFISSQEAANFLLWAGESEWKGPVNAASKGDISHRELLYDIEGMTGRQGLWSEEANAPNPSPYAFPESWTMDATLAVERGFAFRRLHDYLPGLLRSYAQDS